MSVQDDEMSLQLKIFLTLRWHDCRIKKIGASDSEIFIEESQFSDLFFIPGICLL